MEVQNIVPVEWNNQRVLLSVQLAEAYNCSVEQIKKNFSNNKNHYKEGLHYFKIAGELLEELRVNNLHLQISPMTRTLYLWTEQGAVRHCKSINTKEAWEMFDKLEENYFHAVVKNAPVLAAPVEKVSRPLSPTACVYALLMSNGTVKIGHSGNVKKRVSCIESKHGLTVEKIYHTPFISREIARLIEKACHNIFSPSKVDGEFFSIKFESACAEVDTFVKFVEALPLVSNFERGKILVELAISLKDSQTKEYIAINATNLIVGQCSA